MSPLLLFTVLAAGAAPTTPAADGVPDPGRGVAPPGSEGLLTILQWIAWVGYGLAVAGVIFAAIGMVISHRRGEGGEHVARLGWVFAGAILIGAAAGLIDALI